MGLVEDRSIVLLGKADGAPAESWWLSANGDFYQRAQQELARMQKSRFAQIQLGSSIDDLREERKKKFV